MKAFLDGLAEKRKEYAASNTRISDIDLNIIYTEKIGHPAYFVCHFDGDNWVSDGYLEDFGFDSQTIASENIKLPVDSHGCPDWAYMDSFMEKVMKESEASLENLRLAVCV